MGRFRRWRRRIRIICCRGDACVALFLLREEWSAVGATLDPRPLPPPMGTWEPPTLPPPGVPGTLHAGRGSKEVHAIALHSLSQAHGSGVQLWALSFKLVRCPLR